ncbi:antitermination protein [Pannonibacter sp.]|uniref:antitermination protein n=1 Tax=Pannonibacter sp. TaxID=1906786 RepID=UPI003F70EC4A
MLKTIRLIACAASVLVLGAVALANTPKIIKDEELTRINCANLTLFVSTGRASADDLCRPHGGLAASDASPSSEGLVILVRNTPVGGFKGRSGS